MELTPLEQFEQLQIRTQCIAATFQATEQLMSLSKDADAQINWFKTQLRLGRTTDEDEKRVTVEAMKDAREATDNLVALATLMEEKFGISA